MVNLLVQIQQGRIGLNVTPPQYDLKIQAPDLEIKQAPAEISLKQPAATLEIDSTPARESLGYCGIEAQLRQFNQDAMAASMDGIDRRVQEGETLGAIEKHISIAQVISQTLKPRDRDLELVNIAPIRISIQQSPLQWQVEPGGVSDTFTPGFVHGELTYGTVHSYLEQKPEVQIQAVGTVFDTKR